MNSLKKRLVGRRSERGNTLIEVLITLVIMGIGLLGVAQMQTLSLKSNFESDQRVLASNLVSNIFARLRSIPTTDLNTYFGVDVNTIDLNTPPDALQVCTLASKCTIAEKIQYDINQITGTSDLSNASACITMAENLLTIIIAWDGIGKLSVAPTGICPAGSNATNRRSLTVETLL